MSKIKSKEVHAKESKESVEICDIYGHERRNLIAVCAYKSCNHPRLMCSKCLSTLHKSHQNFHIKLDEILDDKKLTKHWPEGEIPRRIAKYLYQYRENDSNKSKKSLEIQIDNLFRDILHIVKKRLDEIKILLRTELFEGSVTSESKLESLKVRYESSFDLKIIKDNIELYMKGNTAKKDIESKINNFFSMDREHELEVLKYLFNSMKPDIHCETISNYNLKILDEKCYKFVEKLSSILDLEAIKQLYTLDVEPESREAISDTMGLADFISHNDIYMRVDFLKPVFNIKNAHQDQITNLHVLNVKLSDLGQTDKSDKPSFRHFLITTGEDLSIKVWDLASKNMIYEIEDAHNDWILSLAIIKPTKEEAALLNHDSDFIMVTSSSDGMMRFWDWRNGQMIGEIPMAHSGYISQIEILPINPDSFEHKKLNIPGAMSKLLITASWDKEIKFWDWINHKCVKIIQTNLKTHAFNILPISEEFVASKNVKSMNLEGFESVRPEKEEANKYYLIANAGWGSDVIKLWDWQSGNSFSELKGTCNRYDSLINLPYQTENNTSYFLAAAGYGKSHCIEIWNYIEGVIIKVIENAHSDWIKSIKVVPHKGLSHNSKNKFVNRNWIIISGSGDGSLKFWDWSSENNCLLKSFDKHYCVTRNGALLPWVIESDMETQFVIFSAFEDGKSIVMFAEEKVHL